MQPFYIVVISFLLCSAAFAQHPGVLSDRNGLRSGRHPRPLGPRQGHPQRGIVSCRVQCLEQQMAHQCDRETGEQREICMGQVFENRDRCLNNCPRYDESILRAFRPRPKH